MVENNCTMQIGDLDYQKDVKIYVPIQLKKYIIAEMLHFLNDKESQGKLSNYDSIIEWNGKKIEWKNGFSFGDKLPLEIYWDVEMHFEGCLSKANADYIIFVKKHKEEQNVYDIFCMNYPELVKWWWDSGKAESLAKFQKLNKPTFDSEKNRRHVSSWYPYIINKIPRNVLFEKKICFDASFLFKNHSQNLEAWL